MGIERGPPKAVLFTRTPPLTWGGMGEQQTLSTFRVPGPVLSIDLGN